MLDTILFYKKIFGFKHCTFYICWSNQPFNQVLDISWKVGEWMISGKTLEELSVMLEGGYGP